MHTKATRVRLCSTRVRVHCTPELCVHPHSPAQGCCNTSQQPGCSVSPRRPPNPSAAPASGLCCTRVHSGCELCVHTRVQEPVDTCGAVGGCGERRGAAAGGRGETFLTALVILSGSKSVPGMFLIPGSIPAPAAPGPPAAASAPHTGTACPQPGPTAAPGPGAGAQPFGGLCTLRDTQRAPTRAPALAAAIELGGGGTVCSPTRGPGLAPTRDPAAADAVFPTRARDTQQRVAHPASGTAAPAPSLARSQRRVQPEGFQGAVGLGLRGAPHSMRRLWGSRGRGDAGWAHHAQPPPSAVGTHGVHTRVRGLGGASSAAGWPGVFVGCGVQRMGVQGLGVQGLTCSPTHACAGVCPAPRGRGVAGAVGVRGAHGCAGSPGSRGCCGCFLAHPLRQGLGRGTRGAPAPAVPTHRPWVHGHAALSTDTPAG